ncbi:MAG: type II toxin-antitoxin system RelE family toxin [Luteolibacter sp.]
MQYRLLISIEVVEFLERLPSKTRKALRNAIAAIGVEPIAMSDASDFDDIGRQLQIAIIGDFALTYWIDDADRHVKILDVHAADR